VAVVAEHPPPAPAEHHAAQEIGAASFGVDVAVVAVAGAAPRLAAGGEFVVHPLGDQRLVSWFGGPAVDTAHGLPTFFTG
jgi:hypothetical protein